MLYVAHSLLLLLSITAGLWDRVESHRQEDGRGGCIEEDIRRLSECDGRPGACTTAHVPLSGFLG
jgi:hypothetical protein